MKLKLSLTIGIPVRVKRGSTMKQQCPFYVSFVQFSDSTVQYRCNGINAIHTCPQDPMTWDRYARYRNRNPEVRDEAVRLASSGIRSGQAATFINDKHGVNIQPKDIHRIVQTVRDKSKSLSDAGVSTSETDRLLQLIQKTGDRYRVKYKDDTQVVESIFYWDPADASLARRFCQVIQVDSTFKDNVWRYPLLEITATTNEMNTFLIAQALIPSESAETLLWVLQQVYHHIFSVLIVAPRMYLGNLYAESCFDRCCTWICGGISSNERPIWLGTNSSFIVSMAYL